VFKQCSGQGREVPHLFSQHRGGKENLLLPTTKRREEKITDISERKREEKVCSVSLPAPVSGI